MKRFLPVIFFTLIFAHEPKTELPDWKNYYRLGTVMSNLYLGLLLTLA